MKVHHGDNRGDIIVGKKENTERKAREDRAPGVGGDQREVQGAVLDPGEDNS